MCGHSHHHLYLQYFDRGRNVLHSLAFILLYKRLRRIWLSVAHTLAHLSLFHSLTPYPFVSRPAPPVTPSDSVVRRSISQQKSGMSVTIDDAAAAPAPRQPSPPRGKLSAIVHVSNLVSW